MDCIIAVNLINAAIEHEGTGSALSFLTVFNVARCSYHRYFSSMNKTDDSLMQQCTGWYEQHTILNIVRTEKTVPDRSYSMAALISLAAMIQYTIESSS